MDVSDAAGVRFMQGFQKIEIESESRGVSFADLLKMCVLYGRWFNGGGLAAIITQRDMVARMTFMQGAPRRPEDTSLDALRRCGEERGDAKRIEQQHSAYLTVWFAVWR